MAPGRSLAVGGQYQAAGHVTAKIGNGLRSGTPGLGGP
ncbi:MAG: hypothetical protein K0S06_1399 [Microvirga sp.]|jgi:hypothetical protein|nr:hypothetical protein [Microvirga sp.]